MARFASSSTIFIISLEDCLNLSYANWRFRGRRCVAFLSYAKRFDPILPIIESSFNIVLIRDLASYLQMLRYLLSFPTSVKTSDSASDKRR